MSGSYKNRFHLSYIKLCLYILLFLQLHGSFLGWRTTVGWGWGELQTRCGWKIGETTHFSLLNVCNRLFHVFSFHFFLKKCHLFLFGLLYFFYWSCDSVSNSKHGHWNLCCSKRFSLPQTTKEQSWQQSLTELLKWKSNKIWVNDPSSHIICNVESFDFFALLAAHTVSFHCVRSEEKDLGRPSNKKTLRKFLNFIYLGIYEEQRPCGQWTKLPSWQISKHKIMCHLAF